MPRKLKCVIYALSAILVLFGGSVVTSVFAVAGPYWLVLPSLLVSVALVVFLAIQAIEIGLGIEK